MTARTEPADSRELPFRPASDLPAEEWVCDRLLRWLNDPNRKPAVLAFTAGPLRQVADTVEMLLAAERRTSQ